MRYGNTVLYRAFRLIYKPLFHIVYRPVIIGRENIPAVGGAVIAGNHIHALDPLFVDICTGRVIHTLAKKDLHDGPFGFVFRAAGTIPVDLHSAHNPDALNAAVATLNDGELVNVSPEAKRNYTNEILLPFKYGAAVMSVRTGAPIVPYAIYGGYKPFRSRMKILIGKPILPRGKDAEELNRELYNSIARLLESMMPYSERKKKNLTSFDDWSKNNEKTP